MVGYMPVLHANPLKNLERMIKTAFTCNALRVKHFLRFLPVWFFSPGSAKHTARCKQAISAYFGNRPEAVFLFGTARMGLYSLLVSGHRDDRDEVIVAGYTCVVVTNAIKYAGLQAVYIDVEEETLNIDRKLLSNAVTARTKAIIITHNYGITCEYVEELKREFPDIMIIEDAAHTFGSTTSAGKKAGTLGDASFFSLEYSKPLTTGMGGIILVNNSDLQQKLEKYYRDLPYFPWLTNFRILISLKMHLFTSSRYSAFLKKWLAGALYVTGLLYKSSPGELQGERPRHYPVKLAPHMAYLLYRQLVDIKTINKKKGILCSNYRNGMEGIKMIRQYYHEQYNFVRYPILFDQSVSKKQIDQIKSAMKRAGIVPGEWFNDVVHPRGSLRYCYIDGSCPVGESLSERMINLPVTVHRQLNEHDLQKLRNIFMQHLGEG